MENEIKEENFILKKFNVFSNFILQVALGLVGLAFIFIFNFAFFGFFLVYARDNIPILYDLFTSLHFIAAILTICYMAFLLAQIIFNKDFILLALTVIGIIIFLVGLHFLTTPFFHKYPYMFFIFIIILAIANNNKKN